MFFKALEEIAQNIIDNNIKIKHSTRYMPLIKAFLKRGTNKTYKKKLVKQSGGFIGFILPKLLPVLASVIGGLVSKD